MEKQQNYQVPTFEVIVLEVEKGFAASGATIQSFTEDEELSY